VLSQAPTVLGRLELAAVVWMMARASGRPTTMAKGVSTPSTSKAKVANPPPVSIARAVSCNKDDLQYTGHTRGWTYPLCK
jgi:hypothetical protein